MIRTTYNEFIEELRSAPSDDWEFILSYCTREELKEIGAILDYSIENDPAKAKALARLITELID